MSFRAPQFAVKSEMEQDCWEQKRHLYAKWIALQIHTSPRRCQWAEKMRKMRTRAKSPRLQLGRIRCHESDWGSDQCSIPNAQFSSEVDVGLPNVPAMQDKIALSIRPSRADMSPTRSCGQAPLEPQTMPRHAERKVVRILFTRCGSCKKNLMKRRSGSAVFSPKTRNSAESLRLQLLASGPPASRSWYIAFGDLPELALAGSPTP